MFAIRMVSIKIFAKNPRGIMSKRTDPQQRLKEKITIKKRLT